MTHVPRAGYVKLWPEEVWCPVCRKNAVVNRPSYPFYLPKFGEAGGERVVIYVCSTCYQQYKNAGCKSVEELKEYHKCRLEYETHIRTLAK